jgi:hypothetical protein
MSLRDDQPATKHRSSPSIPQPSSFSPSPVPQPVLSHVPRFALIHDLATGVRTHAPVTYLFANEPHPSLAPNDDRVRTLVIDLSEDGEKVVHSQSLSGEWQLVSAKIGTSARLASIDGGDTVPGNTVLNIEGMGQFTPFVRSDDVFELAKQFSERHPYYVYRVDGRNEMIRRLIEKSQDMMNARK